jgi:predicted O-methyltransferase YrrM
MTIPSFEDVMQLTRTISSSAALEDDAALGLYVCLIQVPRAGIVVETGCQIGRSSSMIAQLAQAIGFHSIHIDPYCCEPPGVASESEDYRQRWVTMMRRIGGEHEHRFTLLCMRTDQAYWMLDLVGRIDLAYIDGDHSQNGVEVDLALVASRIKTGGLLTAHDYGSTGLPDVKPTIDAYVNNDSWEPIGVWGTLGVWRRK